MDALKGAYPSVRQTVVNLDPIEQLLQQTVRATATTYQSDCALWVGLDDPMGQSVQVYSMQARQAGQQDSSDSSEIQVSKSPVTVLPAWILEQRRSPHLTQVDGELVVPVLRHQSLAQQSLGQSNPWSASGLQLLLQLRRIERTAESTASALGSTLDSINAFSPDLLPALHVTDSPADLHPSTTPPITFWSAAELASLAAQSQELGLLYSVLYSQQRLQQSRQQVALLGRIAQLLNSSLDADEIVEQIIAELGQWLGCDRCLLIRLQARQANVMSYWDAPEQEMPPINLDAIEQAPWQAVEEAFLQEGASYLQVPTLSSGSAPDSEAEIDSGIDLNSETDPNSEADPETDSLQAWVNSLGATSTLVIPVFIQTEFFGVVSLLSYQPAHVYRLEALQTARQVADHLAIALTNAQHYQHLWHRHDILRSRNPTLQQQTLRDELTQLLNRKALDQELEHLSSRALWTVQTPFTIIFCDLDYFKLINDTHGYQTGNTILQKLAKRFQNQLRQETPAYRYDGEEFVVLLTETTLNHALDVGERLRQAIQTSPVETTSGSIGVTASFGIAQQDPSRDRDAYSVLRRAEQALLEAKRQGRDCVKVL